MVLFLSLVVVSIVVRNLKQSLADYNAIVVLADKEQDNEEVDGPVGSLSTTPSSIRPPLLAIVFFLVVVAPVLDVTIPRNHVVPCLSILLVFLGACSVRKAEFIRSPTMMSTIFCAIPTP